MTRKIRMRAAGRGSSVLLATAVTLVAVAACGPTPLGINPYTFVGRPTLEVRGDLQSLQIAPSGRAIAFAGPLSFMGQPAIFSGPLDGAVRVVGPMTEEVAFGLYWTQNETSFTYSVSGKDGMEIKRLTIADGQTTTLARTKGFAFMAAPPVGDNVVWYGSFVECFDDEPDEDAADVEEDGATHEPEEEDDEEPAERPVEQKQVPLPENFPWGVLAAKNDSEGEGDDECAEEPRGVTPFTMLHTSTGGVRKILEGVVPELAAWSQDGAKLALMYRKARRSPLTLALLDTGSDQPIEVGQVAERPRSVEWTSAGDLVTLTEGPGKLTIRRYLHGRDLSTTTVDYGTQVFGRTFLVLSPDGKRVLYFDDFHRRDAFIPEDPDPQSHPEPTVPNAVIDLEAGTVKKLPWRVVPHGWLDANRVFISTGVGDYKQYRVADVRSL